MSKKNEYQGHLIREVYPDSIAEAMEIEPGDVLLRINNQKIEDVFDYRYMIKDEYVEVLIRKPDGEEWLLEIEKEYDDDLGVEFENGLMSDYRSCSNKCIFCFIDQMPPGMRETLYFKDDDSRLSFLAGQLYYPDEYEAERCGSYYRDAACADQYFCADNEPGAALQDAPQSFRRRKAEIPG